MSFSRLSPSPADAVPAPDASALLAALATYRCAVHAADRHPFAPADGAFNGAVARLLSPAAMQMKPPFTEAFQPIFNARSYCGANVIEKGAPAPNEARP